MQILNFERFVNEAMSQPDLARVNDAAGLFDMDQMYDLIDLGLAVPRHIKETQAKMANTLRKKFPDFKLVDALASDQAPNVSRWFDDMTDVLRSQELKDLLAIGLHNVSTDKQILNGNIVLSYNPNYSNGNDWAIGFFPSVLDVRRIINKKVAPHKQDQTIKRFKGIKSDKEFFLTAFRWVKENIEEGDKPFTTKRTSQLERTSAQEISELVELVDRLIKTKMSESMDELDLDLLRNEMLSAFNKNRAEERRESIKVLTQYFNGEQVTVKPNAFIFYNQEMLDVLSDPLIKVNFGVQQIMFLGTITDLSGLDLTVPSHLHSLSLTVLRGASDWRESLEVILAKMKESGLTSVKYLSCREDDTSVITDAEVDDLLKKHGIAHV